MATASSEIIFAFDAYGTLLSTSSIAKELARQLGNESQAQAVAIEWRRLQLEYTWRLNSMRKYHSFSKVTRDSLAHALRVNNIPLENVSTGALMEAYDSLSIFADVGPGLQTIAAQQPQVRCVVFSNGTQDMVSTSVHKSPDLQAYSQLFEDIVVIDDMEHSIRVFKPAPETYLYLAEKLGLEAKGRVPSKQALERVWLVSSNPFDIVGARAVGMNAAWVDREGKGWIDACGESLLTEGGGRPSVIVSGIDGVWDAVKVHVSNSGNV